VSCSSPTTLATSSQVAMIHCALLAAVKRRIQAAGLHAMLRLISVAA
jgi:hypothetical protein